MTVESLLVSMDYSQLSMECWQEFASVILCLWSLSKYLSVLYCLCGMFASLCGSFSRVHGVFANLSGLFANVP